MKAGTTIGGIFSAVGILVGGYFGVSPILQRFSEHQITSQTAGVEFAIIGTILGISCTTAGIILNRYSLR
jgi:hypothetical protein